MTLHVVRYLFYIRLIDCDKKYNGFGITSFQVGVNSIAVIAEFSVISVKSRLSRI